MEQPNQNETALVHWLSKPEAYTPKPPRVEHIETHISHIFLAGSHAYKLKKPVHFDFLDYTTVASRELACREELRLNRRLASDIYLDVVPVTCDTTGNFQLRGNAQIIDWLVEMRRLPTELTLDTLHRQGKLTSDHIERLAATLARFYRSLPPLSLTPDEYRDRCRTHVRSNFDELLAVQHHLPRGVVERVHGFQLQLLSLQPAHFDNRVRTGHIVDGHGDLRPEHICFTDPLAIFDCIEFSPEFRALDVADELAFLAAECDFLDANWVGPQLMRDYQDQSGDCPPALLFDFYKSYRSCVRAKVAALRADQVEGQAQVAAAAEASRHLALADTYIAPWLRPIILVVGGAAGTGKTTLASALADELGAELLRTDVIRQDVFGAGSQGAANDDGIYSRGLRHHVYDELFRRATELHRQEISVVLDGTFSELAMLRQAHKIANDPRSLFFAIECTCRPEVARERISRRLAAGHDASEARPETHELQRLKWEQWPADVPQVQIDTEQTLNQQLQQTIAALAPEATKTVKINAAT